MKRILAFTFATLILITLTACGGGNKTPDQLLVGSWAASSPAEFSESGMTVTFSDMTATYAKDKTANSSAKMSMTGAGLPMAMEMRMNTTSTWRVEGDQLLEKMTDVKLEMLTKIPGMPDLSGVMAQQMKDKGESGVTIIKLDKKTLEFKEEETGMQVVMQRQ